MYDPVVSDQQIRVSEPDVNVVGSPADGASGADAILLATEWPEFHDLPLAEFSRTMRQPVLLDARNYLDGAAVREAGLTYLCMGRPNVEGQSTGVHEALGEREFVLAGGN